MRKILSLLLPACLLLLSGCGQAPSGEASREANLVFLSEDNPPACFIKHERPEGMFVDLIEAITHVLKIKPAIKVIKWHTAYNTALHTPNVVLFPTALSKERKDRFYWVGPIIDYQNYFYRNRNSNINFYSLEEAKKYLIGTVYDFNSEQLLKKAGFTNIRSYDTPKDTVKALMKGEVQLIITDSLTAEAISREAGYSVRDLIPVYKFNKECLYIAISKGTSKEVVREWKQALTYIKRNRTFLSIYKKWYVNHTYSLFR